MPIASVNGLELNYQLEGDGPDTVVLVNGLADDLWTWDYQVPALLEAGFQLLRFDNRGVGASSKPIGPYTTRMFAEDTKALVDHLGLSGFHMLGISMGGMIAQEYALGWPADLASVVLACTYAAPGPFCGRMYALWAELAVHAGLSSVMRDVLLWCFTPEFFEDRPEEAAEFDTVTAYGQPARPRLPGANLVDPAPRHHGPHRQGPDAYAGGRRRPGHIDPRRPLEASARKHPGC